MTVTALDLLRIGAIQFGQFERHSQPGVFDPLALNLRLLPAYPSLLTSLAEEISPLPQIVGLTHLLTTATATPIGVAVSLATAMPLIYPSYANSQTFEGAFDFDVPTLLLTDVLTDGVAEQAMIKQAKREGLIIRAIVAVIDYGKRPNAVSDTIPIYAWRSLDALLDFLLIESPALTPATCAAVRDWVANFTDHS